MAVITNLKNWLANKPRKISPKYIVMHSDAGRWLGSLATLIAKGYSYHLYIHRDGSVTQCVPLNRIGFHAGITEKGSDGTQVSNSNSIGICFENFNDGKDKYTPAQIKAAKELVAEIAANTPSVTHITTHRLITLNPDKSGRSRKVDPLGLDVEQFANGLKVWKPWPNAR
ncbi:MAG: N-acetylmuramoyl-L-alanine amidase [Alphaproteobacteria bacterium]|nr:MAG: N-acetylmuramoyl-L-alanine amidase [Alphaproteobacteria bacterium]